ncbi:MAG: protein-disulfide reductase DsbD domain-containing protein [Planctomycetota bacterium]
MIRWLFLAFPWACTASPGRVQDKVRVEELVELTAGVAGGELRPGRTLEVALEVRLRPGWHIYWKNPGASGLPPELTVKAPPGFRVGTIRWPRPRTFGSGAAAVYGYEERAVLFVPVTAPDPLPAERPLGFEAELVLMVCREVCLLGTFRARVDLAEPGTPERFTADRAALPRPLADLQGARAALSAGVLEVTGPAGAFESASFFPEDGPGISFGTPSGEVLDGRFRLRAPVKLRPEEAGGRVLRVAGVAALGKGSRDPSYEVVVEVSGKD